MESKHRSHLGLDDVPGVSHSLVPALVVVLHPGLHVVVEQIPHLHNVLLSTVQQSSPYLGLQFVGGNTRPDLHHEDDAEEDGEGEGHAVVLLDGTTAPEEGDEEDDASDNDEEDRSGEELVAEEVQVLTVGSLDDTSSHDQEQS